jgi:D-glycero-D-manno-heptose 1,7-bisphosphate phosphatase
MNLVILDRDGVINENSRKFIRSPEDWMPIPGSLNAIAKLNRAGFRVVVATNQSGIRRRLLDIDTLNRIHELMHHQLAEVGGHVEAIFICPCHPKDDCSCFKPNPGMLLDIAARVRVSLETVPYIGDRLSDIEAARAAGARPILVKTGLGEKTLEENPDLDDVGVFENLAEVADSLIANRA